MLEMHKSVLSRKTKEGLNRRGGQLPAGVRSASQRRLSSAVAAINKQTRSSLLRAPTAVQIAVPLSTEEMDVSLTPLKVKQQSCGGPINPVSTPKLVWDLFQVRHDA